MPPRRRCARAPARLPPAPDGGDDPGGGAGGAGGRRRRAGAAAHGLSDRLEAILALIEDPIDDIAGHGHAAVEAEGAAAEDGVGYVGYGEVRRFIAVVLSAVGVGGGSAASPLAGLPAAGQAPVAPRPASALAPAPLPPHGQALAATAAAIATGTGAAVSRAAHVDRDAVASSVGRHARLGAAAAAIPTDAVTPLPSHPPPPPPTPALSTASPGLVRATIATASADAAAAAAAAAATTAAPASYPASYGDDGAVVARGVVGSVAASTVPRDEADVALRCLRAELRDLEESSAASSAAAVAAAAVAAMEARASTSPHQSPSAAITPPPPPPPPPQQPSPQHGAAAAAAGGGAADLALQLQIAHHEVHLLKEHLHAAHRRSEALQLRLEEREGEAPSWASWRSSPPRCSRSAARRAAGARSRPRSSRRTSCRPPSAWSAVRARVGTSRARRGLTLHPRDNREPRPRRAVRWASGASLVKVSGVASRIHRLRSSRV